MCGRVNVSDNEGLRLLLESFGMPTWPARDPRFNVAPTQSLDVVKLEDDEPVLTRMSWGLSMYVKGAKGQKLTKRVPNARDDKVWSSYLWRRLIPGQRVLVPVNGFYEWKRENKKLLQAFYVTPASSRAMFMAGLYRLPADGSGKAEVSIVTTAANESMSLVHHRMPVILLSPNEAMAWMQETDRDSITALMKPVSNDALVFSEVSSYVNKSSNEGPQCVTPAANIQGGLL